MFIGSADHTVFLFGTYIQRATARTVPIECPDDRNRGSAMDSDPPAPFAALDGTCRRRQFAVAVLVVIVRDRGVVAVGPRWRGLVDTPARCGRVHDLDGRIES
ncbi:hypothetical protein BCD49_34580 [Pseudofrankia sp. EUN1h]|nr:hypothetical protein BCD49_34580 [Pseudofrankia sp. EUN1h]